MPDQPHLAVERPAPPPQRPTRDPARTTLAAGAALLVTLLGLIVLAWLVLFITKGRFLKPTFQKYASSYSGRDVRVAGDFQFYFDPLDVKFLAEGLTVTNPKGPVFASKPNFWESKLIDVRVATLPLIFGKQRINWINLQDGHIDAEWDAAGKRNTWSFGPGAPFKIPEIVRAQVAGSTVRYRDPKMQVAADIKFDPIAATGRHIDNSIRFSGGGTARGVPFTLYGAQTSPNDLIAGGRNRFELHARAAATQVDVAGTLPGMTVIEGADLNVGVRGQNLARLLSLAGIVAPDTRAYRLRSHLTKAGGEYRFTGLTGVYGNSDIAGRMTVSYPDNRVKLDADLSSRRVDIVDLGPFIGYNPNALATKGATAAVAQPGGAKRILPDAPLRYDAIKAFDAHVVYRVADIKQPFVPISNIALTFDLDHSLLKLSPLTADIAGGHIGSDISINARGRPVETAYDIRLSPTPMGKLLKGFGVSDAGTTGTIKARVQMKGEGDTLRDSLATSDGRIAIILPKGTFYTSYTQLAEFDIGVFVQKMFEKKLKEPVEINCGLIGFTVRDGVAAADPVLIDTQKNVMTAKGGFSFKDESMDLRFRADGKKFSLFSGQSPVGIQGHFASPAIQIVSPQLIARGGAAVALGAVVMPPAALLAFVDPGDAKSAACGPVLAGASAAAQRTAKGDLRKDIGTRADNRDKAKTGGTEDKKKKFLGIF